MGRIAEYDLDSLARAIDALERRCHLLAQSCSKELNQKMLADQIYGPKRHGRDVAYSQFKNNKLTGTRGVHQWEIDLVLSGLQALMRDFAPVEKCLQLTREILRELDLDPADPSITSARFLIDRDNRTLALASHDPRPLQKYHAELRAAFASVSGDVFPAVCQHTGAIIVSEPPASAKFENIEVLVDSMVYDCRDWVLVPDRKELRTRPIQACYATHYTQLRIPNAGRRLIAFQANTSGFAVIPVHTPDTTHPVKRFLLQEHVPMPEAGVPTRTSYFEREITTTKPDERVLIVSHDIFYNGLQESFHAADSGSPNPWEWLGKRVEPGTVEADLAVILPESPQITEWRYARRRDGTDYVFEHADQRERVFESSWGRHGSFVRHAKAIWKIPAASAKTVFSFQWTWDRTCPRTEAK